ncbi:autotransporter translocation and assembly factor TamB [Rubricella aquisinus]|uniref:Autotransporter translocation and assembly factor TamB n=1 Tax=Rubricella aquisinus TaxID=2028108 RepID=A0A840X246_9RHOB|nr:translocation/assembly module TamB domain-containing protein [Rubricella aquisinus]MBB5516874.1 autotransporter translocation and assembly factor TamB [Rubricella aquisinus]
MRALALITLILTLLAGPSQAQTSIFNLRSGIVQFALEQVSTPGSFEVTADEVDEPTEGETRLRGVRVSDGRGTWIEIDALSVRWNAARLLRGQLEIEALQITGMRMTRLPDPAAEAPEIADDAAVSGSFSPFAWPRSPIGLIVNDLTLRDIFIADTVLAQAIRFDATGQVRDEGDVQRVSLQINRRDGVEGNIALFLERLFDSNTLTLDIDAAEAPGGMVAAYTGLPEDSPVRLDLSGRGPQDDWLLELEAEAENVVLAQGSAGISYVAPLSVQADFALFPGAQMGEAARTVLGDAAILEVAISENADGLIAIDAAELTSPALQMTADGTVDRASGALDLRLNLNGEATLAALSPAVDFDGFSFDATMRGATRDFELDGFGTLRALETAFVGAEAFNLTLEGGYDGTTGRGVIQGAATDLRLDRFLIPNATLSLDGSATAERLTLDRLALRSNILVADASGSVAMDFQNGTMTAEAAVADLGQLARTYGQEADGAARLTLNATLDAGFLDATAETTLQGIETPLADVGRAVLSGRMTRDPETQQIEVTAGGRADRLRLDRIGPEILDQVDLRIALMQEPGRLLLREVFLDAPLLTLEASGEIGAGADDLVYRVETPGLRPVARAYGLDLSGRLFAEGRLETTGPEERRLTGYAQLANAAGFGQTFGTVTVDHTVLLAEEITGRVRVDGEGGLLNNSNFALGFGFGNERGRITGLTGNILGLELSGDADIALPAGGQPLATGQFQVSQSNLAPLGRQFIPAAGLQGGANGVLSFDARTGQQGVRLDFDVRDLTASGVYVESGVLDLVIEDAFGARGVTLDLGMDTVAIANGTELDRLDLSANGPLTALRFTTNAQGTVLRDPLVFNAGGVMALQNGVEVQMSSLDAVVSGEVFAIAQPFTLRSGAGGQAVSGLSLNLPRDGQLTADATVTERGAQGQVAVTGLDLAFVGELADIPFRAGRITTVADFDTTPGSASARVDFVGSGIVAQNVPPETGALDITASSLWDGTNLRTEATVLGGFERPLRARVVLPLRPNRNGPIPLIEQGAPIDGEINWDGDIGRIWEALPIPDQVLSGETVIALRVAGTVGAPEFSGAATLENGRYENLPAGVILRDVSLRASAESLTELSIVANSSDGGAGTVAARVSLRAGDGALNIDGTITARDAVLIRRDDITAQISADLVLDGTQADLLASGDITIDRAEVRLVTAGAADVETLGPIRIVGQPTIVQARDDPSNITLDIRVTAPGRIYARGRGLDSEWGADLQISGTTRTPRVLGTVTEQRGSFTLIGKRFEITEGVATFNGGLVIDPIIRVVLQRETNDLTGLIIIEGTASAPTISLSSVPVLPEEEVLPQLLFGRSQQSLTAGQTLTLASGLATLLSGNAGPLDVARSALGVDVLQIDPGEDGDATVTVGRTIADGVFIAAEQGLAGSETGAVRVEIDIFDNVVIDGEASQTEGNSVGVTYSIDF